MEEKPTLWLCLEWDYTGEPAFYAGLLWGITMLLWVL
jgi:hypothetical protein